MEGISLQISVSTYCLKVRQMTQVEYRCVVRVQSYKKQQERTLKFRLNKGKSPYHK